MHVEDLREADFTIEFDVKNPNMNGLSDEEAQDEASTGAFANEYAQEFFDEVCKAVVFTDWKIKDWSYAGRSNGWLALICIGEYTDVKPAQIAKIQNIFDKYWKNYNEKIVNFYKK